MAMDLICQIRLINETSLDDSFTIENAEMSEGFFFQQVLEDQIDAEDVNGTSIEYDEDDVMVWCSGDPRNVGSFELRYGDDVVAVVRWSSGFDESNNFEVENMDDRVKFGLTDYMEEYPLGEIKVNIYDFDDTVAT